MVELDYTLTSPEERKELVEKFLAEVPNPTQKQLNMLSDYLIFCMEKKERQAKHILTENRLATINKRETSFEGLTEQFENGEDGVYGILSNNKHDLFQPKLAISNEDRIKVPELSQTDESIANWTNIIDGLSGKDLYIAKKALIETRKDQYSIKTGSVQPVRSTHAVKVNFGSHFDENITFDEKGYPVPHGVSLLDPIICSAVLCNYNDLRIQAHGDFDSELWYLLEEFDALFRKTMGKYPLFKRIAEYKIQGLINEEISAKLEAEFGGHPSLQYISSVWRKKIPALLASQAEDDYLDWYYLEEEKGAYKRCSRCGKTKLAHPKYFSKNPTSKDGFYSLCRECRSIRTKERKNEKKGQK